MWDATSILLIDGHHTDRQYYAHRMQVSSSDYVIVEVQTGQASLDRYHSQSIDCVILELELPDMSGFEVLAKLVPIARLPAIPVIVLTRFSNPALLHVATMNGAFVALQKHATAGDHLDEVVSTARATIPRDRKNDSVATSSIGRST